MELPHRYHDAHYCMRCGKPLEIVPDREGKTRPRCAACGWVYYVNPTPAATCVVVNERQELLLVKRRFEPFPGEWAMPSGYMEVEQTPEQCAIDELREETGLIAEVEDFLGYFSGPSPVYDNVLSFAFLLKVKGGRLQAGDDAAEACFVPLTQLPPICFESHRRTIDILRQRLHI